jgi:hypothetical protein
MATKLLASSTSTTTHLLQLNEMLIVREGRIVTSLATPELLQSIETATTDIYDDINASEAILTKLKPSAWTAMQE